MELRPLKTEAEHREALAEIDRLFDAQPGTPEEDRLDLLTLLVEAYEAQHHPILPPDPVAALEYYIESRGLTPRDLEPYLGDLTRVEEVLNRRRSLTITMIRRLHQGLGIPAEILIQPYPLAHRPPHPVVHRRRAAVA